MQFKIGKRCIKNDGYMHNRSVKWYFKIKIGYLSTHYFKEYGDWFWYFTRRYKNNSRFHGFRFSSAGFLKY